MANARSASPATRRYLARFIPLMIVYAIVIFGVSFAFNRLQPVGPMAWALAIVPALPILGVIAVMGLYLREEADEFQRAVLIESMLWGIGLTLAGSTVWGLLEFYVNAPRVPVFWAFPAFCGAMGLAQPFVRRRYL
jgi:hypothetical protein